MKNLFRKPVATKSCPIKLSTIPEARFTSACVEEMLASGTPIYAWYDSDKLNVSSIESFTDHNLQGLFMIRKEIDFLATYVAYFVDGVLVFRLYEVSMFSKENIEYLMTGKLSDASCVMYDDTGITRFQQTFSHDVTEEMVRDALKNRKIWVVGDEHFHKS